jgi:hypothetical protein
LFPLKQERLPNFVGFRKDGYFGNFPRRHYPDRVLGYFLSPATAEHPCFNNKSVTFPRERFVPYSC